MKATYWLASACLFAAVAGCRDNTLAVPNTNNPNVTNVFATGAGIEAAIAAGFQTEHNAIENENDLPSLITIDREQYSQLNNFSMGPRGGIPVAAIQNYRGGASLNGNYAVLAHGARLAANAVNALDALTKVLGTTGPNSPLTANTYVNASVDSAEDMRDRAFAFFIIGMDQARMAMQFDSVGIIHPGFPADSVPPLCQAVNATGPAYCASSAMADAIRMLDTAEALASKKWGCTTPVLCTGPLTTTPVTPQSLAIPATWLGNNGNSMSVGTPGSQFPQFIRSWRAYFRAMQARNSAERADTSQGGIVDWSRVIQDAESGITADFVVTVSSATGYNRAYVSQGGGVVDPTWGQVEPMFYGMADTTGAYVAYLANAPTARGLFLIQTPDKRFPAGASRAAQQAASPYGGRKGLTYTAYPYINNRTQQDGTGDAWGVSEYDNYRNASIPQSGNVGVYADLLLAQINLLAAEGHLRLGTCTAVCLNEINTTRTKAGLPAIAGVTLTTAPTNLPPAGAARVLDAHAGTAGCVPQVPYASLNGGTACGDIWEAMKYEYRMETEYVGYAEWYWYNRGFNDLIDGTAYEWPVPNEEMDARYGAGTIRFYVLGGSTAGTTGTSSNTGNTYGNFGFKF